jgi:hypothetical protein
LKALVCHRAPIADSPGSDQALSFCREEDGGAFASTGSIRLPSRAPDQLDQARHVPCRSHERFDHVQLFKFLDQIRGVTRQLALSSVLRIDCPRDHAAKRSASQCVFEA